MSTVPSLKAEASKLDPLTLSRLRYHWPLHARPKQLPPRGDWLVWLVLAGRGFGKTRTGAEWVRMKAAELPGGRGMLLANTPSDARDVMITGPAGIMNVCPEWDRPAYEPSKLTLTWRNGFTAVIRSANNPEAVRGPEQDIVWADELAAWPAGPGRAAWDNAMFGLRLGEHPQACVTTTPKPIPLVKELLEADTTAVTRGSTYENEQNLAKPFLDTLLKKYEGTSLGRQEIYAEVLDEVEGALWTRDLIDENRASDFPELIRVVVGVDPSGGVAEAGIVTAALGEDEIVYVLSDASLRGSADTWAREAVGEYHKHGADRIVAESNFGGDMVENTIRTVDRQVSCKLVRATRGKQLRAEPVAALYEQGRVKHVGTFPVLEGEMTSWVPGESSPNRLDALVWAVTDLALGDGRRRGDPIVY